MTQEEPKILSGSTGIRITKLMKKSEFVKSANMFKLTPGNVDSLYDMFRKSYMAKTGHAWDKEKFISRARMWDFYGPEQKGFVAVRQQGSEMGKLVGVAGSPRGVLAGVDSLQSHYRDKPLWGAVSEDLAEMATRRGMIAPHKLLGGPILLRKYMKNLPPYVFGGVPARVTSKGSIQLDYPDVGTMEKYLVGNDSYFSEMAKRQLEKVPGLGLGNLSSLAPRLMRVLGG
jgi:hypothetical protein